jgi:hypothetical protein
MINSQCKYGSDVNEITRIEILCGWSPALFNEGVLCRQTNIKEWDGYVFITDK